MQLPPVDFKAHSGCSTMFTALVLQRIFADSQGSEVKLLTQEHTVSEFQKP